MQLIRLTLTGSDSTDFLHRQLTADIAGMPVNGQRLSAWCNIKGRVISLLWVNRTENGWILDIPQSGYGKVMPRLKMFVLRDDVQFSEPQEIFAQLNANAEIERCETAPQNWQSSFVSLGIPYLETEACEEYLPQMLNLDPLGGD